MERGQVSDAAVHAPSVSSLLADDSISVPRATANGETKTEELPLGVSELSAVTAAPAPPAAQGATLTEALDYAAGQSQAKIRAERSGDLLPELLPAAPAAKANGGHSTGSRPGGAGGGAKFDPIESLAALPRNYGGQGGVNPSIEPSTTFAFEGSDGAMDDFFSGESGPDQGVFSYSRHYNPTVLHLARQLAALEGTEAAYCTSSGMAAISSTIMQLVSGGDHVVASSKLYGGTFAFLTEFAPRFGVEVSFVDIQDLAAVEAAFRERTKMLYFEGMSNPTLAVPNIPKLAAIAREHGVYSVVDNTFAPLLLSPARLGVDIVVHSLTKFINGASDIIGGAICAPKAVIDQLMEFHNGALILLGGTMNAQVAWQISMRLPHLGIRMREHGARALALAERLESLGLKVIYPGLKSHPNHEILKELRCEEYGFGGMLALDCGSMEKAMALAKCAQEGFAHHAVSLGFHDTLLCVPGLSTAHNLTDEEKVAADIAPGLVRVSVGFTGSLEQRWRQLRDALRAAGLVDGEPGVK